MWRTVLVVLAGCGRLGFDLISDDPSMPGGDANPSGDAAATASDGPTGDSAMPGSPDAPLGAWCPPEPVAGIGAIASTTDPWQSEDRLVLYFASTRPGGFGGYDLFVATRDATTEPFSVLDAGAPINSASNERSPFLAGDTLYFTSNRLGGYDVFTSTRTGPAWTIPTRQPLLSSAGDDVDIALSPDGRTAIVTRLTNGVRRFYRSTRPSSASAWSTPLQLSDLATAQQAGGPALGNDGTLYFHAQRGPLQLFTAAPAGSGFEQPVAIEELGAGFDDTQPHVDASATHLVFVRQGRIVEATR